MRFHVVKRDGCPLWKKLGLYVLAVLAALILGGVVLLALGVNPLAYYSRMFTMGMVGNKIAYKTFENYLKVFVPLALTSVALSLAFKMRFWNIGGEGQFILGAVAAATVAFKLGPALPGAATLVLMCLAATCASFSPWSSAPWSLSTSSTPSRAMRSPWWATAPAPPTTRA